MIIPLKNKNVYSKHQDFSFFRDQCGDYELNKIKEYYSLSHHFIQRCFDRKIKYKDILNAIRNGKYFYSVGSNELYWTKIILKNIMIVIRENKIITVIKYKNQKELHKAIYTNHFDFIFE